MLISENKLRQIIREEILSEVPLDFVGNYKVLPDEGDSPTYTRSAPPAIGHEGFKKKAYALNAKVMFQDTQNSWAIVSLSDTRFAERTIKKPEFKLWLKEQGITSGTKILVVAGRHPDPGDFKSVRWAIGHDIIGHTLANFTQSISASRNSLFRSTIRDIEEQFSSSSYDIEKIVEKAVWGSMSRDLRIGGAGDILPDVLFAIFRGKLNKDIAIEAAAVAIEKRISANERKPGDSETWARTVVNHYFQSVNVWVASVRPGIPLLVDPFGPVIYTQERPEEAGLPDYDKEIPF
jgi:hypothetical protein